ncbi:carboxylesterase/lipase family protein [Streptomyces roseirectus]|uniref:Carboxylic ester hydrolase n=1 Tax=Streptomyces roseirectus TaxID=2768066 RepID=A0A7H0IRK7_9ACTN|nr:carboxylesterase family protein [Streptomyces roseirectus]QNP75423.1 carboxylesterase/lipase family protein [Streptomyces roseirectus]
MTRIIDTGGGKIRGVESGDGVLSWRGIPYAAPPVGDLRWRLPRPAEPWTGVRDGSRPGNPAMQPPPLMPAEPGPFEIPPCAEDCLYLNVTAPADAERAPVLVWLHGGGYHVGNGHDMVGDGAGFARDHGVVVVSLNYRLGALGHLSLPDEEHTGAYGTHDQIAALRWIHDTIEAFGGDPGRVTVYGVSAGAKSISNLIASPLTRGLIHAAATSSGGDHVATPAQSRALAARFRKELGTDALRDAPAEDVLDAQNAIARGIEATWVWRPAVDGLAIPRRPTDAIADGAAAGIPLLAQHCVSECLLYEMIQPGSAARAAHVLEDAFGPTGRDAILAAHAPGDRGAEIMTAERYAVPTDRLADAQSAHAPVWRSRYDGPLPPAYGGLPAFHGSDAPAIWTGGDGVAGELHAAWGQFATTGTPGWTPYTLPDRATMLFTADGPRLEHDPDAARRTLWEGREWQSGTWYAVGEGF